MPELHREIVIGRPRETVFAFFADACNLEVLTPPWLSFHIETPAPIAMKVGARIDYRLRLYGVSLGWTSEITVWEPPHRFVDEQLSGPYRKWIHEHRFEETGGGTIVGDHVLYAVPGGAPVNRIIVAPQLKKIFDYRHRQLLERFPAGS